MKRILLILLIALLPSALHAYDLESNRPYWSVELKYGHLVPDIENWSQSYEDRYVVEYGGTLAYKITRQIEAGLGAGYSRAQGEGFAPLHNQSTGHVVLNYYPVDAFLIFRGIFNENQWVVPYAGGGWTRVYYREEVQDQGVARGFANGFHIRGGLQFQLDGIDPNAAHRFYQDFGVHHTYIFMEAKYSRAMADTVSSGSVNLGGKSLLGGLLFEF